MPHHSAEFGSALPGVAEIKPLEEAAIPGAVKRREQTPLEKAQLMWDTYQDIKTSWVDFVRTKRSARQKEETGDKAWPRLRDNDNPLSREFRATPQFKKLHGRLTELWSDTTAREAWRAQMQAEARQWVEVNGSWEEYLEAHKQISELEAQYDGLQKEKFAERGRPSRRRRRTLADDVVDVEVALAEARTKVDELFQKSPELAAKILASEFKERRKELHSPEGFMWFRSRREILEAVEKIVTDRETLRLIVLEGEAGTGKTTLAEMLARHFTDHPALHVEVGEKTKADRALFADEKLEAGSSPTVYKPVLYALTGKKRPTETEPEHDGRAVFLDELNKMNNDEGGVVATVLDRCRVGGKTGYHLLGANPDDEVRPKALALAAQNPAGGRFRGRTDFTPEVKRKMEIVRVEYFPQAPDNPELYEAFLVALSDTDGRIRAKKDEVGPAWKPVEDAAKKTKQDKLETGETSGGALWRMTNMLHEVYENLAHRPNALTRGNPDAWIGGRVLPPGDIFKWLKEYQTEVKKGTSLEYFLSSKLFHWLETSFQSAADAGDKQLYLELAEKFGLMVKTMSNEFVVKPPRKIKPDFLTERQVAELSPRVPRKITGEGAKELPKPPEFESMTFDCSDYETTAKYKKVAARVDKTTVLERYVSPGPIPSIVYRLVGTIKECAKYPALIGKFLLENESKPEQKLVAADLTIGLVKKESEAGIHEIVVQNARNPYYEAWAAAGVSARLNLERTERRIDLEKVIAESVKLYADNNLGDWERSARTADLNNLTLDKRQLVEQLVGEGYEVVGVMPGREAMLKQVNEAMERLKPLWIKNGAEEAVDDPYRWDYISGEIFGTMLQQVRTKTAGGQKLEANEQQLKNWLDSLPTRPYLELTPPTQKPPAETTNKKCTAAEPEQQNALKAMQRTRPEIRAMHPGEYALTQALFTRHAASEVPHPPLTALDPLDKDTYTRFIDLPVSSDGYVPGGYFYPDNRQLRFRRNVADYRYPEGGFRLSVRVEL